MIGWVVVTRTFTSSARLFLAFSKSWLLQASTCARAMLTAADSWIVAMGISPLLFDAPLRLQPVNGQGRQAETPFCEWRPSQAESFQYPEATRVVGCRS